MKFLSHILYNYSYSEYEGLFLILIFFCKKTMKKARFFFFSKNVRHLVISAEIKNRMICAIAINILNLKPFGCFVSNNPSPRFHQQRNLISNF